MAYAPKPPHASKKQHEITADTNPSAPLISATEFGAAKADSPVDDSRTRAIAAGNRRIKLLRITQSLLSAALSAAIAAFQARVYITYQNSRGVNGAWPTQPDLLPTLLLLSVAAAAIVFDLCMLGAYLRPEHRLARAAFSVARAAYYIVTSAKTVSYAIGALVARTSYNYGSTTGQNNDLWSWTCTDQAAAMESVNQAPSNCNTQLASFAFALFQLFIEAIGWFIDFLVFLQGRRERPDKTVEGRNQELQGWSGKVDGKLNEIKPNYNIDFPGLSGA